MIEGAGELRAGGKLLGRAEYKITVLHRGGSKSASGVMWAPSEAIMEAFMSDDVTLVREDCGFEMRIAIKSHNGFDAMANIAVDGSPGPE